jgi:hypothetical protein
MGSRSRTHATGGIGRALPICKTSYCCSICPFVNHIIASSSLSTLQLVCTRAASCAHSSSLEDACFENANVWQGSVCLVVVQAIPARHRAIYTTPAGARLHSNCCHPFSSHVHTQECDCDKPWRRCDSHCWQRQCAKRRLGNGDMLLSVQRIEVGGGEAYPATNSSGHSKPMYSTATSCVLRAALSNNATAATLAAPFLITCARRQCRVRPVSTMSSTMITLRPLHAIFAVPSCASGTHMLDHPCPQACHRSHVECPKRHRQWAAMIPEAHSRVTVLPRCCKFRLVHCQASRSR